MSVWDYLMPHRLLINKSLRREADGLRVKINACSIEYDRRVEECQEEIKGVEAEYQEKLRNFEVTLEKEMQEEKNFLKSTKIDIESYVDKYLFRKSLEQKVNIKNKKLEILGEEYNYLSKKMDEIGREIDYLKETQNRLISFTDVKDIIKLISLSGYEISFDESDDAKDMLNKVSQVISNYESEKNIERFALGCLRGIIQEKSEYLPTIKYIEWVIQQKIQMSKQYSKKRRDAMNSQKVISKEIRQINNSVKSTTEEMKEIAKRIRYYWAHPITYLNVDISYEKKEITEAKKQIKNVGEELHKMASVHSDDQYKWIELQEEREKLVSKKDSLKNSITSKKEELNQWIEKRNYIFEICNKFEVRIMNYENAQTDEEYTITTRLNELKIIKEEGRVEAEKKCEKAKLELVSLYNKEHKKLESDKDSIDNEIKQLQKKRTETLKNLSLAEEEVKKIKDGDDRFFLMKILKKKPELIVESNKVSLFRRELIKIDNDMIGVREREVDINTRLTELDDNHKIELENCVPIVLRPTQEEVLEENKLLNRIEVIKKRRKGGGNENKN